MERKRLTYLVQRGWLKATLWPEPDLPGAMGKVDLVFHLPLRKSLLTLGARRGKCLETHLFGYSISLLLHALAMFPFPFFTLLKK